MDKIKKNINIFVASFLLFQPFLDLITGLNIHLLNSNLTLGIVLKVLFMLSIIFIALIIYKKKKLLLPYLLIGFYCILFLIGKIFYPTNFLKELQELIKVFYFPIILVTLYSLKDDIKISKMTFFTTLFLYLICIFIPLLFNAGYKTYEITKAGTLGFYNSANEISGILSLLTPLMFIILLKKKNIFSIITILIYLAVILMIGTKTPLLAFTITIFFSLLYLWIKSFKEKSYKVILISLVIVITSSLALVFILPKTNFYKNIKTHLDYLGLDSITDVFTDEKLVDHFIFSQRLTFLARKHKLYEKAPIYQKLFGIGYYKNKVKTKMVEMDYFDILFSHGIVGFIIFFGIVLYVIFKVLRNSLKINYQNYMLYLSFFLIIFLSFFTGHIITGPSVSFISSLLIISLSKRKKKDLLFADVNLDIGGIEKAQVILLDNINYNKYNVTLVLEEKKGKFLRELNKNVTLREVKVSTNNFVLVRKVVNYLRKVIFEIYNYQNYDFSCCYTTYSYSSNKLVKIASSNTCLYVHNNYGDIYEEKEFREFFDSRKVDKFNHIIFVSNESASSFLKFYPNLKDRVKVFNNFIDTKKIKENSLEKITVEHPKDKKLLVFVGRLDEGQKRLTRAINLMKEINCELWIIGSGPDENMYQDLVKELGLTDKVFFLGPKSNPYPYMKEADYLLLTSEYEGFPVVYLEAIALKKIYITTIDVSDDNINFGIDYAHIIPKDEKRMVKEVKKILKSNKKFKDINIDKIQKLRIKKLEKIFDEV